MNRVVTVLLSGLFLVLFALSPAFAVEVAPRISDREIVEALTELKAGQHRLDQRIDGLEHRLDQRIDGLEHQMNLRFDDMKWFLGIMIGALLVINTGVLGYVLKRQGKLEQAIETIKNELAFLRTVIEKLLPPRQSHL